MDTHIAMNFNAINIPKYIGIGQLLFKLSMEIGWFVLFLCKTAV